MSVHDTTEHDLVRCVLDARRAYRATLSRMVGDALDETFEYIAEDARLTIDEASNEVTVAMDVLRAYRREHAPHRTPTPTITIARALDDHDDYLPTFEDEWLTSLKGHTR